MLPTPRSRGGFALAAIVLALAGSPATAGPRGDSSRKPDRAQRVSIAGRVRQVLDASRGTNEDGIAELSARIANLGTEAIPVLLSIAQADTVPFVRDAQGAPAPETVLVLDGTQVDLVVAALERFDRSQLVQPMGTALSAYASPRLRKVCTQVLGRVGDRRDLKLLFAMSAPVEPTGDVDPEIEPACRAAAAAILTRDFSAFLMLRDLLREQPAAVRLCLYRALADTASAEALPILCHRLGFDAAEDPLLLGEIARVSRVVPLPPEIGVADAIRPYLLCNQPVLAQSAAVSLGGLEDTPSVPNLIALLCDQDSRVREVSHEALCAITGEKLLPDPERWNAWYLSELAWLKHKAPEAFDDLRTGAGLRKAAVISEIAEHPLFREEIAGILQRLLPHESTLIRKLGLSALGQLGAASALPYLQACSFDPEVEIAAEARAAMERIQRRRPPSSVAAAPGS